MKPQRYPSRSPMGVLGPFSRHPVEFLTELAAMGEPAVRSHLGPFPQWFVFDAELGRELLQPRDDDFNRPPYMRHLTATATGANLFSTTGDTWRQHRRVLQPEFHRTRINELVATMSRVADAELATWPTATTMDMQRAMSLLTMRVAGQSMFGIDLTEHEARDDLASSFRSIVAWLTDRFYNPKSLPAFVPTSKNREMRAARSTLRSIVGRLIWERREHPADDYDVLQILLDARLESGRPLSDDEIIAESIGFLFAGHDTTASTLTWATYEMGRNPAIANAARTEGTDVADLELTGRIVKETLRLHPPAWGIARTAKRTTQLGPYRVPWMTGMIVSTYTIHRSAQYWDAPDEFDPDRFLAGRDPRRPAHLPFSFGAGPRMCIGQAFAEIETKLVLARVLNRFELTDVVAHEPAFYPEFSLRMRDGLPLTLQPRVPAADRDACESSP